ncbi:AraC family transcriptional regulator [Lachnoclostridium sp.]|uniref:AraC family transcriptional regulator n=1 Tax=Lachnoclostridium sp. TaxID=2028282 RepID=UPI0028A0EF69|nr:AraC family transcriptional regulator [Lachnoclostridium sp.]
MFNNVINTKIDQRKSSMERYIHFYNVKRDVDLTLIQTGYQKPYPYIHIAPSIRDHFLLHFICSGQGHYHLQHSTYSLSPNDCFLIYPHEITFYKPADGNQLEYYWLGFCGSRAADFISALGFTPSKHIINYNAPEIPVLLSNIVDAAFQYQEDALSKELYINSLIQKLFFIMLGEKKLNRISFSPSTPKDNTDFLGQGQYKNKIVSIITLLIQTSYHQDIHIETIADNMHLNRSYLSALFKQETGRSIKQYLQNYRLTRAESLLTSTNLPIYEISYSVGFQDPMYFSRLFKSTLGITPSQYRNKHTGHQ